MEAHQLINQDSRDYEYYTPPEIIKAAREVLGVIDLDPASSPLANERVGARMFYTAETDGLTKPWFGRVWLNHPFNRETNALWIRKLVDSYSHGDIAEACCITYAATSELWFRPLLFHPQCFLIPRTNYYLPDGTKKVGVTKGSVVTYLGNNLTRFRTSFSHLGVIKI